MTSIKPDTKTTIICHCSGTTEERIKTLIDNKIDDLDSLSRMTGACSGCGGCETSILALLTSYNGLHGCTSDMMRGG